MRPRIPPHDTRGLTVVDSAMLAALAIVALQLVPLPPAWTDWLSPEADRVRQAVRLDALIRGPSAAIPLSVDPAATWHALATLLTAALTFYVARAHLAAGGVRRVCRAVTVVGLLLSLEALIQRASTPLLIYGFWSPGSPAAQPFGPFFNRNHFAGWVLLAMPLALGYLIAQLRSRSHRSARAVMRALGESGALVTAAAVLAMLVALVATQSRSALVGLVVATVAGWWLARDRPGLSPSVKAAALLGFAGVLLMLAVYGNLDALVTRFGSTLTATEIGRVAIWRETAPMLRDFWFAGVGAGGFDVAMLAYQRTVIFHPHLDEYVRVNHAHNHYLNVAAEGGLLLAVPMIAGLVGMAVALRRRLGAERGEIFWVRVGAVAALAAIAVQSLWDVPLVTPANAILCALAAAIALHRRERDAPGE
jgi:O-antigen ligase